MKRVEHSLVHGKSAEIRGVNLVGPHGQTDLSVWLQEHGIKERIWDGGRQLKQYCSVH